MLWKPPTEQEKHIMKEFRDVFRDIIKADDQGLLYVRDIRFKMHRAQAEIQDGGLLTTTVDYLKDTYGIGLTIAEDGLNFMPTYEIVDEHKYLIFMMKF